MIFQGATWNDGADNDFGIAFVKKCLFGIRAYSGKRDVASAAEEQITTLSSLLLCWGKCLIAHFIVLD